MATVKSIAHLLDGSNRHQRKAIQFEPDGKGPLLVLAGAGAGKTQVLTKRLVYLTLKGIDPRQILALTFTEAAAREMGERAITLLTAYTDTVKTPLAISTFHSLAFSLIREGLGLGAQWSRLGYKSSPKVAEPEELNEVFLALQKMDLGIPPNEIRDLCKHIRYRGEKGQAINPAQNKLYQFFYAQLIERGLIRFDDMVPMVLYLFTRHEDLLKQAQARYHYILVDEFQDTSPDQLEILRLMALPENNLFLVGDDYQAIYGFRGANKQGIKKLWKLYPEITLIKLQVNYRSTAKILAYANTIFTRTQKDMRKKLVPGRQSRRRLFMRNLPVGLHIHVSAQHEASWMQTEMQRLVQNQGLQWNEFAVLYRTHALGSWYQEALRSLLKPSEFEQIHFKTVHGAKGLEFPVVFLVGVEEGYLPYGDSKQIADRAHFDEERRLFYVAVTRAEMLLHVSACRKRWSKDKYEPSKPSNFLMHSGNILQRLALYWKLYMHD